VYIVIFSGKKKENGDNWYSAIIGTFPVHCIDFVFVRSKITLVL